MFKTFRKIYGPNLVANGIVEISTRDTGFLDSNRDQIVEGNLNNNWFFYGREGNYVKFHLKRRAISICGMTIHVGADHFYNNPSFALEVSNGAGWKRVFTESRSTKLAASYTNYTWQFDPQKPCSYFRLYATENQGGETTHGIYLSSIDFIPTPIPTLLNDFSNFIKKRLKYVMNFSLMIVLSSQ